MYIYKNKDCYSNNLCVYIYHHANLVNFFFLLKHQLVYTYLNGIGNNGEF